MSRLDRTRVFFAGLLACVLFGPGEALCYIGPGAGFAFVGSFLVLVGAFFAVFAALMVMPVRVLWRWFATRKQRAAARVKRCIVVGLDGLDPELVQKYMAEGKMPNFQALADPAFWEGERAKAGAIDRALAERRAAG